MALELTATIPSFQAGGPHLTIVDNGATVTITWAGGGTLQGSSDIGSPANWTNVAGSPASPFTIAHNAAAKFYRVTVP